MTRHYCCYFDHRYLVRGLAMIRSLRRFESESPIWVLCLDAECRRVLGMLEEPGVRMITTEELETAFPDLLNARRDRSLIEYYFTLTPALVHHVLDRTPAGDSVTYVDGDLWFFGDPAPLHAELGQGSVSITPHRFPDSLKSLERYGKYNVGWLTFQNDGIGAAVAKWWRARCVEWCYDRLDGDRFADQKYLESFERLFPAVVVLRNPGANLAPWNLGRHHIERKGDTVLVDGTVPLIFFHFHGLQLLRRWAYYVRHRRYRAPFGRSIRRELYRPYVSALAAIDRELLDLGVGESRSLPRNASARPSRLHELIGAFRRLLEILPALLRGHVVLVLAGRAI